MSMIVSILLLFIVQPCCRAFYLQAVVGGGAKATKTHWDADSLKTPEPYLSQIRSEPWRGGLEPAVDHEQTADVKVEGRIPKSLVGTLLRNGAGRSRFGTEAYGHWFDGDGMVSKAVFTRDGKVLVQNRYVRTPVFEAQEKTGKAYVQRRAWTQAGKGGFFENFLKMPANTANTNVQDLFGKILALQEGSPPVELDGNLETVGNVDFAGQLESAFSAHPTVCPDTNEVYNLGMDKSSPFHFRLMRWSPEGQLLRQARIAVFDGMTFLHDNVLSSKYFCFVRSPWLADKAAVGKGILGLTAFADSFSWQPEEKTQVFFFDRETLEQVACIDMAASSFYHIVNAYETDKGTTVVLGVKLRGSREVLEAAFASMYTSRFTQDMECDLVRYEFDVASGELLSETNLSEAKGAEGFELPVMDERFVGKANRYVYCNSLLGDAGFLSGIQVADTVTGKWQTYNPGPGRFAGVPTFIPAWATAKEGEGYVLSYVYESATHTSSLVVLDAMKVASGPLCTVRLPYHLPAAFHGCWTDRVLA